MYHARCQPLETYWCESLLQELRRGMLLKCLHFRHCFRHLSWTSHPDDYGPSGHPFQSSDCGRRITEMLAETEFAADERAENKGQRSRGRRSAKLWVAIALAGMVLVGVWLMEPCQVREMARS